MGFRSGRRDEEDRDRQQNCENMNSGGNSGNNSDHQPFNPRHNAQLRYNPGHDRGRAYGSHARGWQRNHHPGYCFSGSRINVDRARAGQTSAQVIESKSFLSFFNAQIRSTIKSIGTASGSNLEQGIELIKDIECGRLLETPNLVAAPEVQDRSEDFGSKVDSDFGLDLDAIKHLTGDIAENMSRFDGSPLMDLKPTSKPRKASSSRKNREKNKAKNRTCSSQ
jgi:hypothetical protein